MQINKTYKYKLKLTKRQTEQIDYWLHTCRAIYNLALETKIHAYKSGQVNLSKFDLQKQLTELKREDGYEWIGEVSSQSLQDVIERMDKAYQTFFRGEGFPRFSKKDNYKSITFKSVKWNGHNRFKLPKFGSVKFHWSKDLQGVLKRAIIIKEINGYYINILTQQEIDTRQPIIHSDNQAVGIDVGVNFFAVSSDDEFVDNPRFLKANAKQMRILQRKLARQVKQSNNWRKTKHKIVKLHLKTKNQRKDFLHKTANNWVYNNSYDFIFAEKLQLKNMTKSTKGTTENPGKNVVQKSKLNHSIIDLGAGMFFEYMRYKSVWNNKVFIQINPAYTSQTCSKCGYVDAKNRKSQAIFLCIKCGHRENADRNASNNIKREGISLFRQREALACA